MTYMTREQINANLNKSFGTETNAHPAVQIFSRHARNHYVSDLNKEMLIADAREVRGSGARLFVVRHTAVADRLYVAQNWFTGEEHGFTSISALKAFLSGRV